MQSRGRAAVAVETRNDSPAESDSQPGVGAAGMHHAPALVPRGRSVTGEHMSQDTISC